MTGGVRLLLCLMCVMSDVRFEIEIPRPQSAIDLIEDHKLVSADKNVCILIVRSDSRSFEEGIRINKA